MMVQRLWIVIGRTDAYDSSKRWAVAAYHDKEAAELHVERANDYLKVHELHHEQVASHGKSVEQLRGIAQVNPFDVGMQWDVIYPNFYELGERVPLVVHPDQYIEEVKEKPDEDLQGGG